MNCEKGFKDGKDGQIAVSVPIPGVVKRWLGMCEGRYRPEGAGDWRMTMVFWIPEMDGETWRGEKSVDEMRIVWRKRDG